MSLIINGSNRFSWASLPKQVRSVAVETFKQQAEGCSQVYTRYQILFAGLSYAVLIAKSATGEIHAQSASSATELPFLEEKLDEYHIWPLDRVKTRLYGPNVEEALARFKHYPHLEMGFYLFQTSGFPIPGERYLPAGDKFHVRHKNGARIVARKIESYALFLRAESGTVSKIYLRSQGELRKCRDDLIARGFRDISGDIPEITPTQIQGVIEHAAVDPYCEGFMVRRIHAQAIALLMRSCAEEHVYCCVSVETIRALALMLFNKGYKLIHPPLLHDLKLTKAAGGERRVRRMFDITVTGSVGKAIEQFMLSDGTPKISFGLFDVYTSSYLTVSFAREDAKRIRAIRQGKDPQFCTLLSGQAQNEF